MTEMSVKEQQIWQEFLAQADTKALFFSVVTLNYDDESSTHPLVRQILTDETIDLAVVKAFYFRLGPGYVKQYATLDEAPDYLHDTYRLLEQLEEGVATGFYTKNEFYYDPASDFGENWLTAYPDIVVQKEIPAIMKEALDGEADLVVDEPWESFEDGLPFDLAEKLYED
ncbi:DUF4274 domain-containing protein [Listeria costaricensis]|uniref:DUF4274 domain-containing protein n=1 Tax=Listeria costaricensis TaxID=2026604 RepID=UPI000C06ACC1|nr:DUF4274 domain-containing protein [Listeria costaricensis]